MQFRRLFIVACLGMALLWSCGKDDGPTTTPDSNSAPTIEDQSYSADENIADTEIIAEVIADDTDTDDTLTFSMVEDISELFEITDDGKISLREGKTLDFEALENPVFTITVKVSDDDGASAQAEITITVENVNEAPEIGSDTYEFEVAEDIEDTDIIGEIEISFTDSEEDMLTITEGDDTLFEINGNGELSLVEGMNLDYETATIHTLTISVSDGELSSSTSVTINVTNVIETLLEDPTSFITTWKSDNPGESINTNIIIPTFGEATYNYTVYWQEVGNPDNNGTENNVDDSIEIQFDTPGIYQVAIKGDFPRIYFNTGGDASKILTVDQWGTNPWSSMGRSFYGCNYLTIPATDAPDLSNVTDMTYMFRSAALNQDIGSWNVSNVENMLGMFQSATNFNQDISSWNVSNVKNMQQMFRGATAFNQDISGWDVSNVTNMQSMFDEATAFNQPIGNWAEKTGNVGIMRRMFRGATAFNQDISGWDVSNVTNMQEMFLNASAFNRNLGNWDISSVTDMTGMLDNSGLSANNYGATLIGWETQEPGEGPIPSNITLGATNLEYCANSISVAFAIATLEGGSNGWTINGHLGIMCTEP